MKFQRTLGRIGVRRILLVLGCLLAATLAVAPALAVAEQAASEEYDLAPLPEGTGEDGGTSQNDNTVGSAGSGGGGPNSLLIALAAIAAVCTGFAIWRLRKHSHHHT